MVLLAREQKALSKLKPVYLGVYERQRTLGIYFDEFSLTARFAQARRARSPTLERAMLKPAVITLTAVILCACTQSSPTPAVAATAQVPDANESYALTIDATGSCMVGGIGPKGATTPTPIACRSFDLWQREDKSGVIAFTTPLGEIRFAASTINVNEDGDLRADLYDVALEGDYEKMGSGGEGQCVGKVAWEGRTVRGVKCTYSTGAVDIAIPFNSSKNVPVKIERNR
jgi:hypothetical protein